MDDDINEGLNPEYDGSIPIVHSWIDDFLNELEEAQNATSTTKRPTKFQV